MIIKNLVFNYYQAKSFSIFHWFYSQWTVTFNYCVWIRWTPRENKTAEDDQTKLTATNMFKGSPFQADSKHFPIGTDLFEIIISSWDSLTFLARNRWNRISSLIDCPNRSKRCFLHLLPLKSHPDAKINLLIFELDVPLNKSNL